jgi:hypothetical protein
MAKTRQPKRPAFDVVSAGGDLGQARTSPVFHLPVLAALTWAAMLDGDLPQTTVVYGGVWRHARSSVPLAQALTEHPRGRCQA